MNGAKDEKVRVLKKISNYKESLPLLSWRNEIVAQRSVAGASRLQMPSSVSYAVV